MSHRQQGSNNRRHEPWRNQERHYCAVCNAWMGSDRQSILLHENGKKHKENAERAMVQKRQEHVRAEQQEKSLQASLQAIESAALASHANDLGLFAYQSTHLPPQPPIFMTQPTTVTTSQSISTAFLPAVPGNYKKQEKQEWQSKRKQREEEKRKKREKDNGDDDNEEAQHNADDGRQHKKRRIAENEGHYTYEGKTYLDGVVFGDMLEEEMPLEIWTGNLLASAAEKKLPERHGDWKNGIVAAIRTRKQQQQQSVDWEDRLVVDVAYLREPTDTEETLDRSVPLNRIRIVLGSDDMIPNTLEEARIMAMGGQEEQVLTTQQEQQQVEEIDEATGLTAWTTVSVKKTTIHQELKEERERERQKRREAAAAAERMQREADARKMEEAKVANADDSALGAYDVWSRSKEGYKGVDIHGEAKVEVHDFGKKLTDGKTNVGFKKVGKKKKQNRRTTSADDD